ncbi:MAG: Mov34/MPN/PAD-1 family protein [Oscillibacter sp.]|nr:Mov34/MPN/PAD-1 family protein [Oscillibacter sp.]
MEISAFFRGPQNVRSYPEVKYIEFHTKDPECLHVVVSRRAYTAIIAEVLRNGRNETGGVFIGNIFRRIWYIVDAIEPGIHTLHETANFVWETDYVNYLASSLSGRYKHPLSILGFWHRHPGSMDYFSDVDVNTIQKNLREAKHGLLSMLVNIDPKLRMTYYYCRDNTMMKVNYDWGDEYFIPDLLAYATPEELIDRSPYPNIQVKYQRVMKPEQLPKSIYTTARTDLRAAPVTPLQSAAITSAPPIAVTSSQPPAASAQPPAVVSAQPTRTEEPLPQAAPGNNADQSTEREAFVKALSADILRTLSDKIRTTISSEIARTLSDDAAKAFSDKISRNLSAETRQAVSNPVSPAEPQISDQLSKITAASNKIINDLQLLQFSLASSAKNAADSPERIAVMLNQSIAETLKESVGGVRVDLQRLQNSIAQGKQELQDVINKAQAQRQFQPVLEKLDGIMRQLKDMTLKDSTRHLQLVKNISSLNISNDNEGNPDAQSDKVSLETPGVGQNQAPSGENGENQSQSDDAQSQGLSGDMARNQAPSGENGENQSQSNDAQSQGLSGDMARNQAPPDENGENQSQSDDAQSQGQSGNTRNPDE